MEEISPETELPSPPSPKRARTEELDGIGISSPLGTSEANQNQTDGLMNAEHLVSHEERVIAEGDEDETPLSCGVGLHETGAQMNPRLIQAGSFCSDQGADTHPCHTLNQLERNLRREETCLREDVPQRTAEGRSSLYSKVEGDLSQKSELQICNVEPEGQFDQNGLSKTFTRSSEDLIPCNEFVSGRNVSAENVSFKEHDYVGADLSAELQAAAGVSQEPAEEDNEADAFRVIDPVIWSEIGREAERLLCSSYSNAGGELALSVQLCEMETSPEGRTSQDSSSEWTRQLQDQRTPQTLTEHLASSAASYETQDQTDSEGSRPAEDDGICGTAGPNLSICSTVQQLGHSVEEAAGIQQADELGDHICDQRGGGDSLKRSDSEQRKTLSEASRVDICLMEGEEEKPEEVRTGGDINSDEREANETQRESYVSEASPGEDVSEWMENASSFCNEEDPEQRLGCLAHGPHTRDIPTLFAVPTATDAVVPCQAHHGPTSLSNLTYLPSGFSSYNGCLGGLDTFEKIQLSADDDDDGGPSIMPVLTSSPRQLLGPPEEQGEHCVQATGSEITEGTLGEEEEGPACHSDNMESGLVSCDVPSFKSAADVSASTELEEELSCGSASPAVLTECPPPSSDRSCSFDFGMREQFGRVLQELSLFFDISRNEFMSDCRTSSPDLPESLEDDATKPSEQLSSSGLGPSAHTSTDHSLVTCGVDPEVSRPVMRRVGEQEVPLIRNLVQEPLMDSEEKNKGSWQAEQKSLIWSPSFMSFAHLEQLRHKPPELHRRLEPLKTCTRPIRVGLSKRAKTKQLHHLHPYK